jgi:hypothetical protein
MVCCAAGDEIDDGSVIRQPDGDTPKVVLVGHGRILSANEIRGYNKATAKEFRGYKYEPRMRFAATISGWLHSGF